MEQVMEHLDKTENWLLTLKIPPSPPLIKRGEGGLYSRVHQQFYYTIQKNTIIA